MSQLYANNVEVPLAAQVLSVDIVLTLQYPEYGYLPVLDTEKEDYYMLTLHEAVFPEEGWEVVKVTASNGSQFTVERGQEGTTVRSWAANAMVSMRLTSESLERLKSEATLDTVLVGDTGDVLVGNNGKILVAPLLTNIIPPPSFTAIPVSESYIQYAQGSGEQYAWWRFYYDASNLPTDYSVSIRHNNNSGNDNIQYSLYNLAGTLLGRSGVLSTAADTSGITVTDGIRMGTGYYYIRLENLDTVALNIGIAWGYDVT